MHLQVWITKETRGSLRYIRFYLKLDADFYLLLRYKCLQSFKEMVGACLVKDPKKRPTSEKLLKHPFFKHARSIEYLERSILAGMPPLGERFRMLKVPFSCWLPLTSFYFVLSEFLQKFLLQAKEADIVNKALYEEKEHLSQVRNQSRLIFQVLMKKKIRILQ